MAPTAFQPNLRWPAGGGGMALRSAGSLISLGDGPCPEGASGAIASVPDCSAAGVLAGVAESCAGPPAAADDGSDGGGVDVEADGSCGVTPARGVSLSLVRSMMRRSSRDASAVVSPIDDESADPTAGGDDEEGDDAAADGGGAVARDDGAGPSPGVASALARPMTQGSFSKMGWPSIPVTLGVLSPIMGFRLAWEMARERGTGAKSKKRGQRSFIPTGDRHTNGLPVDCEGSVRPELTAEPYAVLIMPHRCSNDRLMIC